MAVTDWSPTAALNITVDGVNIAEGCAPANLNNAMRNIMADVRSFYDVTMKTGVNFYILADGSDPATPVNGDIVFNYTP